MNLKKALFFAVPSAGLMITACGGETTNVTEVTEQVGIETIAAGGEMENCTSDITGKMVFVTDSASVYLCSDKKWISLKGKDGVNGEPAEVEISNLGCSAKDTVNAEGVSGFNIDCGENRVGTIWNGKDGASAEENPKDESSSSSEEGIVSKPIEVTTEFLNQEMLKEGKYGTFVDTRDNKLYRTTKIGNQTWFAQNLDFSAVGILSYCYENKPENCEKYGRLYSWADANNLGHYYNYNDITLSMEENMPNTVILYPNQGICPNGWHVPSEKDWEILEAVAGENQNSVVTALKSATGWKAAENGTPIGEDKFGFSAIAAGYFIEGGFNAIEVRGSWWTSTDAGVSNDNARAASRSFVYNKESENFENDKKLLGYSLRCLKD